MPKMCFGGCPYPHDRQKYLEGIVSLCAAALSFSKNVGMSTCIYNPENEAGHIDVKYVCLHMLTTMHLHFFLSLRWK